MIHLGEFGEALMVCLDLERWEGKEKKLKSSFLSVVWFDESQKEKKQRGNMQVKLELL